MRRQPHPACVLAEMTRLLRELCENPVLAIALDTRLEQISGLDSLRLLQTVALLEEHFNVEVDTGALDRLLRIGDIVATIAGGRRADEPAFTST